MKTHAAIAILCLVIGLDAGYFVGKAVQRHVNQRVENNLFVPVTTNAMVLETNATTLPDGYWLRVSNDGMWTWASHWGSTIFNYTSREKATEAACLYDKERRASAVRTWTEVK